LILHPIGGVIYDPINNTQTQIHNSNITHHEVNQHIAHNVINTIIPQNANSNIQYANNNNGLAFTESTVIQHQQGHHIPQYHNQISANQYGQPHVTSNLHITFV